MLVSSLSCLFELLVWIGLVGSVNQFHAQIPHTVHGEHKSSATHTDQRPLSIERNVHYTIALLHAARRHCTGHYHNKFNVREALSERCTVWLWFCCIMWPRVRVLNYTQASESGHQVRITASRQLALAVHEGAPLRLQPLALSSRWSWMDSMFWWKYCDRFFYCFLKK